MNIIRGRQKGAQKVVIYGPEGVGKSTFAAQFPDAIFIDTEGSTDNLDVARVKPQSWTELVQTVDYFIGHPAEVGTLIIDTADWAERMATDHVLAQNHWSGIEDAGYGKGYVYVAEEFGKLLNRLEQLKGKGVNVVMTAHAQMRKFEQPDEMNAYDRWELKLSKKAAPLVKEWADLMLFANYKTYVVTGKDGKTKATGGTKRVMYTEHTATWDAKNRHNLQAELPFAFKEIEHIIPAKTPSAAAAAAPSRREPLEVDPEIAATNATEEAAQALTSPPQKKPANDAPKAKKGKEVPPAPAVEAPAKADAPVPMVEEGIPSALAALMAPNNVSGFEIQAVVAQKGYYPAATPIKNYDPAFIQGVLIGAWPQVEAVILKNREQVPF